MIDKFIADIFLLTGIVLTACPDFQGIQENEKGKYFNVILSGHANDMNHDYVRLKEVTEGAFDIHPNGRNRAAVFIL